MAEERIRRTEAPKPARRRASRAAGPAERRRRCHVRRTCASRRRQTVKAECARAGSAAATRSRTAGWSRWSRWLTVVVVAAVTGAVVAWLLRRQRATEAAQARDQRFVDTASQTVVNMFSYTQDTIDDSVNRFVDGTSGPLRDMMSQSNNVDNLKAIFRDTNASSEAVINGAALEKVDDIADNAAVLVSVRVTVTDIDGINKPSQPYRLRVIVHEDDNGHMTAYDLKYPDGGN